MEWAKAKARAERWTEEVELVQEEMRRTIESCRWKANWWRANAAVRRDITPELADGLAAYAFEHADLEERFAQDLERRWAVIRRRAQALIENDFELNEDENNGDEPPVPIVEPADTVMLNLRELETLGDDSDDED